eukprot:125901-Rhodomonas_salina.3
MSGTARGSGKYAVPDTNLSYDATHVLCDVRYQPRLYCYQAKAVLCTASARCATTGGGQLTYRPTRVGTDLAYGAPLSAYARATRCPVLAERMVIYYRPTRACYAMPGTELAVSATSLARGGSDRAGGAEVSVLCFPIALRACYAMSGTEIAYVFKIWWYRSTHLLRDVRY